MLARTLVRVAVCTLVAGTSVAQSRGTEWDDGSGRAGTRYGADRQGGGDRDDSRWSLRGGIGFTADPGTFLSAFEAAWAIVPGWTVGPLLRVGVDDRDTIVMPTLHTRFFPDVGFGDADDEIVRNLRPFVHAGLGLIHRDVDRGSGDVDDTEFLFDVGVGLDYAVSRHFSVGTQMSFNVVPDGVLGDKFLFSWQMLTLSYHF